MVRDTSRTPSLQEATPTQPIKRPSQQDLIPSTDLPGTAGESFHHSAITGKYAVAPDTPPNHGASAASAVGATLDLQQRKRTKLTGQTRAHIHRPFRSPMMKPNEASKGIPSSSGAPDIRPSKTTSATKNSSSEPLLLPALSTESARVYEPPPSSLKPRPELVPTRRRTPFRSPVTLGPAPGPGSSAHSRLVERQSLEQRISQLKSSIRKGKLVLRSQESEDVPLEDLVEKWKRVSQAGVHVLLEKYVEQEQVLGIGASWDHHDTGSKGTFASNWGYHHDGGWEGDGQGSSSGNKELDLRDRWRAEEERMELEDVQYDLPTVEEALRSRCLPESRLAPKPVTKMQRLLNSLGIDLDTIGYNPDNDVFSP